MRGTARDREHGGILPIALGMMLVLAAAVFGATTVGRVVIAKGEAQRAADAACLTMANILKWEGKQVLTEQQTRAESLARLNSKLPLTFLWAWPPEAAGEMNVQCKATAAVSAPSFIWPAGTLGVSASANGRARQQTITQAEKKFPSFVLVLDFSGSMQAAMGGGMPSSPSGDSFHTLLNATKTLLDQDYEFRYGMVAFAAAASKITSDVKLGNDTVMKTQVTNALTCPHQGCGCPYANNCLTASGDGLKAAFELLSDPALPPASEQAKYVLFISDGEPTVPGSGAAGEQPAYDQAKKLWDMGVVIHTIHIINVAPTQTTTIARLKNFMVKISGPPEDRGREDGYYHDANDNSGLDDLITGLGGALACELGPIDPAPQGADPWTKLHVFVRDGNGLDRIIKNARTAIGVDPGKDGVVVANDVSDLWSKHEPFKNGDWFYYDENKKKIYVTPSICDDVQKENLDIKVRFTSPQLTL